jgi:serpin B
MSAMVGLLVGILAICRGEPSQTQLAPEVTAPPEDIAAAAQDGNAFAADLCQRLDLQPGNHIFSPYSIEYALAMAYAGAGGQTASQMAHVLHFSLPDERMHAALGNLSSNLNASGKSAFTIENADALWTQSGFMYNPDFLHLLRANYAAELHQVDFVSAAPKTTADINQWVTDKTREKIQNIIAPGALNALTRMVLVNAVYFKGNWQTQFEKSRTSQQPFHLNGTSDVQAPLMHHEPMELAYMDNNDLQAVELPYVSDELSMVALLPRSVDGLPDLEKKISDESLRTWLGQMKPYPQVEVYLPKFKMDSQFDLAAVLTTMGMTDAFDKGSADFSGMTTQNRLYISDVIHKAFVEVNEEGTEAAAATGITMRATIALRQPPPPPPIVFRADHPFLFVIRQNSTGAIVFMGRVENPLG